MRGVPSRGVPSPVSVQDQQSESEIALLTLYDGVKITSDREACRRRAVAPRGLSKSGGSFANTLTKDQRAAGMQVNATVEVYDSSSRPQDFHFFLKASKDIYEDEFITIVYSPSRCRAQTWTRVDVGRCCASCRPRPSGRAWAQARRRGEEGGKRWTIDPSSAGERATGGGGSAAEVPAPEAAAAAGSSAAAAPSAAVRTPPPMPSPAARSGRGPHACPQPEVGERPRSRPAADELGRQRRRQDAAAAAASSSTDMTPASREWHEQRPGAAALRRASAVGAPALRAYGLTATAVGVARRRHAEPRLRARRREVGDV